MNDPQPGKRQAAKAATRAAIVAAAGPMFAEVGYAAVHIRSVAGAVGMSTGAVFSNFADKAELYRACTGAEPPNVFGFLRALSGRAPSSEVGALADEAGGLLRAMIGEAGLRAWDEA